MANGLAPGGGGLTGTIDLNADGCGCTAPGVTPHRSLGGAGFSPTPGGGGGQLGDSVAVGPLDEDWLPPDLKRDPPTREPNTDCNTDWFHVEGDALGEFGLPMDLTIVDFMQVNEIPNGAVAIVSGDGRLVYCKAFTYCKLLQDHGEEVFRANVHSKFRVASVSKAITAVATMAALDKGLFGTAGLNCKAADFVDFGAQSWGWFPVVPELWDIELVHLLTHSAGWGEYTAAERRDYLPDRTYRGSPQYMFEKNDLDLAAAYGTCLPIDPAYILWDQNTTALSGWGVGGTWSYSNHGFVVLGQVLAKAAGMSEAQWVKQAVWDPIGAVDSTPARTLLADRQPNEVKYYARYWPEVSYSYTTSVVKADCSAGRVTKKYSDYQPYAYFNLENALGGSGWVCSVYDLALLMRDLFGTRDLRGVPHSAILSASAIADMLTPRLNRDATIEQCLGFETHWRSAGADDFRKTGHLDGTMAMVYNFGEVGALESNASVIYVFNRYWRDEEDRRKPDVDPAGPELYGDLPYSEATLQGELDGIVQRVADWGTGDLRGAL